MLLMTILMTLVIAGLNHNWEAALQTQSIRDSSEQIDLAFLTLDSEVRYASAVWAPNQASAQTDWNVEFETQSNSTTATTPTCTELQYNYGSGKLSQATWPDTQTSSTSAPAFKVLATGLATGTSTFASPFTANPINPATSHYQKVQLMVTLTASAGTGTAHETTSSSVTFTAVNTTNTTLASSPGDCDPTGWGY